ncbi:MAG: hypothetical protein NUV77_22965 [Thermoguttaceae bacterium]|jgi:hypothetical protein|nr:hypothetical protein [Thermoguttaceae bacterium]
MQRKLVLAIVPILAIAGPPLALSAYQWWSKAGATRWPTLSLSAGPGNPAETPPGGPGAPGGSADLIAGPAVFSTPTDQPPRVPGSDPSLRFEGPNPLGLAEAFRFDITAGWILTRWPRVSAGLAELRLQGYRVPLVTGTGQDDLAGALTYYFNPRQQVQRITFQGTTGDARKLIQFLVTQHRFGRRLTNDPRIFRYEVPGPRGEPVSWLEIRPAQVVKSSEPYHRFEVALVIERPDE